MNLGDFKRLPIMGILRGIEGDIVEPLTRAIISSGLKTVEVTMNTPGAARFIRNMKEAAGDELTIGAGTVLTPDDMKKAQDAGATFIVMPVLIESVAEHCVMNNIPFFPGALTPQEIYNASQSGASMVKVFPAKFFGPSYFKEIKAPFNNIELLACGGVTPDNIKLFSDSGADAFAFGASVFKRDWLARKDFSAIEESIKQIINAFNGKR